MGDASTAANGAYIMLPEYVAAAAALESLLSRRKSLKRAVYDACAAPPQAGRKRSRADSDGVTDGAVAPTTSQVNVGRVMAMVSHSHDRASELGRIVDATPDLARDARRSERARALLLLLLHEHMYGGGIRGGGALKRRIVSCGIAAGARSASAASASAAPRERTGDASMDAITALGDVDTDEETATALPWPRCVRVNTLRASPAQVVSSLCEGTHGLRAADVREDEHVRGLLQLPHDAHGRLQLHAHPCVKHGWGVLMSKASAFSAEALLGDVRDAAAARGATPRDAPVSVVDDALTADGALSRSALLDGRAWACIDACAAPGNKTAHAADMIGAIRARLGVSTSMPCVIACDRDARRAALLRERMAVLCNDARVCVDVRRADFLALDPHDPAFADVRVILLDPSCSGSGMQLGAPAATASARGPWPPPVPASHTARVASLAAFQRRALLHAMRFQAVQRVAYSTCSVYEEEDEAVVAAAIAEHNRLPDATRRARLIKCLPSWTRRGVHHAVASHLTAEEAACVVRVRPEQDHSTGFFVAVIELVAREP